MRKLFFGSSLITQALENNCPIEAIQNTVGHSQIKTTHVYANARPNKGRVQALRFGIDDVSP